MCINFDNKNAAKAIQKLNQPARRGLRPACEGLPT